MVVVTKSVLGMAFVVVVVDFGISTIVLEVVMIVSKVFGVKINDLALVVAILVGV